MRILNKINKRHTLLEESTDLRTLKAQIHSVLDLLRHYKRKLNMLHQEKKIVEPVEAIVPARTEDDTSQDFKLELSISIDDYFKLCQVARQGVECEEREEELEPLTEAPLPITLDKLRSNYEPAFDFNFRDRLFLDDVVETVLENSLLSQESKTLIENFMNENDYGIPDMFVRSLHDQRPCIDVDIEDLATEYQETSIAWNTNGFPHNAHGLGLLTCFSFLNVGRTEVENASTNLSLKLACYTRDYFSEITQYMAGLYYAFDKHMERIMCR